MNNILIKLHFIGQFNSILTFRKFLIQILVGDNYHPLFYFQFNLIILTLFFTIISLIFKQNLLQILLFLGVLSIYLLLSGINYKIFKHNSFKISLGSIIELMPLAVIGCFFGSVNLLLMINSLSISARFFLLFFIYFLFEYDIFIYPIGFFYPNVFLNILASIILIFFFSTLHFDNLILNTIIRNITQFTGGIYYIHLIIKSYLQRYLSFFGKRSYFSSLIIYFICFGICFFGTKLLKKHELKYLFL